jgi:cell wall assembly regulator SMI1
MQVLRRFEQWLEREVPGFFESLEPGYTEAQLQKFEECFGLVIPGAFRTFLGWRRFTDDVLEFVWPFGGGCSRFDIFLAHQEYMRDLARSPEFAAGLASEGWIVFTSHFQWNINCICVDVKGSPNGIPGQVLYYDGESEDRPVIANSFEDFLEVLVRSLENGLWAIGKYDNIEPLDWDRFDEFYHGEIERLAPSQP